MVFFTCNACGESVKRNAVEKHVSYCRRCEVLSCIDCNKEFWGDDYLSHTSCVSEEQRYAATGFQVKPNKGEVKQQEWIKKIEQATQECKTLSRQAEMLMQSLQDYGNIPRKKAKFLNFLKNSLRYHDAKVGEEVWNALSLVNKPPEGATGDQSKQHAHSNGKAEQLEKNTADSTEDCSGTTKKESKKRKRKREEANEAAGNKKSKVADKLPQGGAVETTGKSLKENGKTESRKKKRKREAAMKAAEDKKKNNPDQHPSDGAEDQKGSKKKKKSKTNGVLEEMENTMKPPNPPPSGCPENGGSESVTKFPWNKVVRKCLAAKDGEMSLKRLKKKVLNEYAVFEEGKSSTKRERVLTEVQLAALFVKKLNKNSKVKISKTESRKKKRKREAAMKAAEDKKKNNPDQHPSDGAEDQKGSKKKKKSKTNGALEEMENTMKPPNPPPSGCPENGGSESVTKFPWNKVVRKCLAAKDGEMSLKRLKKKVLNEYAVFEEGKSSTKRERVLTEVQLAALFVKKLNKNSKVKISKDKVKLCT